ncbi:MAG: carbohydrate ABC transporter permease [Clostridiales bacterium]|nr:carbohydrate ABC transporter permease [Clostridiales bacterium]
MAANRKKSCLDEGTGYRVFSVFNTCLLVLILFLTAYPVYFVLIASISDPTKMVANYGLMWLPHFPLSLTSYRMVFRHSLLLSGFGNTLFIVIVGLAFNMVLTVLGAYLLSLKNSLLKKPIAYLILFTMYFSGGIVPGYLNIKSLHLMNTLWALILPGAISTYNMLIMRSAIGALPDALMEAAKLDGASHFQRILNVVVPLTGATSAVLMLYYAVGHWNAWFNASLYIQSPSRFPLQLVLRQVLILGEDSEIASGMDAGSEIAAATVIKYALIVISTVPIMLLYPFLQRFFVKGVMIGSVKG